MSSKLPVLFNKQPILDLKNKLVGFHLSLDSLSPTPLTETQWQEAITSLNEDIEASGGYENLTKGLITYYSAPLEVLKLDLLPKIPNNQLVIEVPSELVNNKTHLGQIKEILASNIKLAIDNFSNSDNDKKLLKIGHVVNVSIQGRSLDDIKEMVKDLPTNTQVILTQVDTEEAFAECKAAGFNLFEGYFFTDPIVVSKEKALDGNSLTLLKLLAALNDPDADFDQLVEIIQTDAILSHKLLSAINHPNNKIPHMIETLKAAVNFMGLKRLKFWVNMMMMSQVEGVSKELMATALIRAKFLETIAEATDHKAEAEKYFMVGLFSTLNAFLKMPMVDIVDKLPILEDIKVALTDQKGPMGKALFVARAMEQGNTQFIMNGHEGMGIMEISSSYMKANGWAHQTLAALEA